MSGLLLGLAAVTGASRRRLRRLRTRVGVRRGRCAECGRGIRSSRYDWQIIDGIPEQIHLRCLDRTCGSGLWTELLVIAAIASALTAGAVLAIAWHWHVALTL